MLPESVLIVEDDVSVAGALSRFLDAKGFAITAAKDGKEALEVLQQGVRPSVLLVDLMMPTMSGWELIECLRRDDTLSQIPVVLISGYPRLVPAAKLREVDLPFIEKPFHLDELLRVIRSVARPSCSRWEIPRAVAARR
jgi:CheY-like chemotaxis protein